jgi:hypothetical protein
MNWITRFAVLTLFFLPPAFADRALEVGGGGVFVVDNVKADFSVGVDRTADTLSSIHADLIERIVHSGSTIYDRNFGGQSSGSLSFHGVGVDRGWFDGSNFGFWEHDGSGSTASSWSSGATSSGATSASTPEPSEAVLLLLGLFALLALKTRPSDRLA